MDVFCLSLSSIATSDLSLMLNFPAYLSLKFLLSASSSYKYQVSNTVIILMT